MSGSKAPPSGGGGGSGFDAGTNTSGVCAVTVSQGPFNKKYKGTYIHGIQLHFHDGSSRAVGKNNNAKSKTTLWTVPQGHKIISVDVHSGSLVDALQFTTDGGYVVVFVLAAPLPDRWHVESALLAAGHASGLLVCLACLHKRWRGGWLVGWVRSFDVAS